MQECSSFLDVDSSWRKRALRRECCGYKRVPSPRIAHCFLSLLRLPLISNRKKVISVSASYVIYYCGLLRSSYLKTIKYSVRCVGLPVIVDILSFNLCVVLSVCMSTDSSPVREPGCSVHAFIIVSDDCLPEFTAVFSNVIQPKHREETILTLLHPPLRRRTSVKK